MAAGFRFCKCQKNPIKSILEPNLPVPLSRIEEQLDISPHVDIGKKSVVLMRITSSMMKLKPNCIPQRHFSSPLH